MVKCTGQCGARVQNSGAPPATSFARSFTLNNRWFVLQRRGRDSNPRQTNQA
jgi:hypothetical protein